MKSATRYPLPACGVKAHALAMMLVVTGACAFHEVDRDATTALQVETVASPAAPGSAEPNLTVDGNGDVWMTWIEPAADSMHAVRIAKLEGDAGDSAWGKPATVVTSRNLFVNWADFPSAAVMPNGDIAVHWLQRSGPGKYSYDVRIARSSDRGVTWTSGLVPHRDGTETEHGFTSMYPLPADSLGAVWLDGRQYDTTRAKATNVMMLMSTAIASDGSLGAEVPLDDRICDCCQTSMAMAARGPVIVYRDRTPEEIRDIYIVRRVDGQWTAPAPVHNDGWKVDFCPVNGPSVSAHGDRVAVAWFSAPLDTMVQVAFSTDGGATFGAPIRVDDGKPAGRVDVTLDRPGNAAWVSWLERGAGDTASVRVRRITPNGQRSPAAIFAKSSGSRASGFPRMVRFGDALMFTWTEPGTPSHVRVAWAQLSTK